MKLKILHFFLSAIHNQLKKRLNRDCIYIFKGSPLFERDPLYIFKDKETYDIYSKVNELSSEDVAYFNLSETNLKME